MLHTSLGGSPSHDRYAPCAPAELHDHGFDYWALGHIHQRHVEEGQGDDRDAGQSAGARRQRGEAPKSATLATIGDDRSITIEERLTSVAEFQRLSVDLAGLEDWRAALKRIEACARNGPRRCAERASRRPSDPRGRDPARLAASSRRRHGWRRRRGGSAPKSARPGSTRSNSPAPSRAPTSAASSDPIAELRAIDGAGGCRIRRGFRTLCANSRRICAAICRQDRARSLFGRDAEEFCANPQRTWRARAPRTCSRICAHPTRATLREDRPARSRPLRADSATIRSTSARRRRTVRISTSSTASMRRANRLRRRRSSICCSASENESAYGAAEG